MNYYPHHIGDFDRATRHLTRTERSIYRDLLDVYYDTEAPLTLDQSGLCRKVIARAPDEVEAVRTVLGEFFHETPTGWYHDRCEQELETYRKTNTQKSAAGKASAAAKAARREQAINGVSTPVERLFNGTSTNQEPITNNQEPEPLKAEAAPVHPKKPVASGTRLPQDWKPSAEDIAYCKTERPDLLPSKVAANFYDYWIAKAGKDGRKVDWSATWRSWVRKEDAQRAGRAAGPPGGGYLTPNEKAKQWADKLIGRTENAPETITDINPAPTAPVLDWRNLA